MTAQHLVDALSTVDWGVNVKAFCADATALGKIDTASTILAHWSMQFESVDAGNPALGFVREMQVSAQHVSALLALAMYKPAAASVRNILETALYYSYFRTHPSELSTLVRSDDFYMSKNEILEYHKVHTEDFWALQQRFALVDNLSKWYSRVSAIVHGQLPGVWVNHTKLSAIAHHKETQDLAVNAYIEGARLAHEFFLCTVGRQLWPTFSKSAKTALLHGLTGDLKAALKLDVA